MFTRKLIGEFYHYLKDCQSFRHKNHEEGIKFC